MKRNNSIFSILSKTGIFRSAAVTLLTLLISVPLFGDNLYEGPNDPAGDPQAKREGFMTGNRVYLYFQNTTELSRWPKNGSLWPNTYEGVSMLDGIGLLIGGLVFMKDDTIPVTDPAEVLVLSAQGLIDTLFYLQTSYREEMDEDPTGSITWGLHPCFGYFNEYYESPAMSNKVESWPTAGWPSSGNDPLKWAGEWNGRFGRGVIYADLETFFVTNDAQDQEYILVPDGATRYLPRPGVYIGDHPRLGNMITQQRGNPWGGLGLRVEQRGFQWNNPQARDAIFWEYTIANISDYDIKDVAFGYWVDNGIGGDSDDDLGYFNRLSDMAYSWDSDGVGEGGLETGIMGFAYLESPGINDDYIDNDDDGLVDERRDNDAGAIIGPTDGIDDIEKFLEFYSMELEDLQDHYEGDEDQDWMDGEDLDGNGVYDLSENPGDDVGTDGVAPGDLNYTEPDADGSECNHKPDYTEGVGCEPNFNATDVSESDMVGLTSFQLFPIQPHRAPYEKWFRNDKSMWEVIGADTLMEYLGNISNLVETFASGPFSLSQGRTERISMSELHSYDPLEGLSAENGYLAPALFEKKRIVQVIYEKDYRFAQPPEMPTLTATPMDGKVILTWNDVADTETRDPFVGNVNDFEGYKLYRATDKKLQDAETITDGYGTPTFMNPIFQCDLMDGLTGFTDFGLINGVGFNLGDDTGIRHYFIDETVENGRTYYYALVAYDYGAEDIGPGIAPSENNAIIELDDQTEYVTGTSKNVQIVTPYAQAAGYVSEDITMIEDETILGTATVTPEILAKKSLVPGHIYNITFDMDTVTNVEDYEHGITYVNSGFHIVDSETGSEVYSETSDSYSGSNLHLDDTSNVWYIDDTKAIKSDVFEGLRLNIEYTNRTATLDYDKTGWVIGDAMLNLAISSLEGSHFPWEYDILFGDTTEVLYTGRGIGRRPRDENGTQIRRNILSDAALPVKVINKSFTDSLGNYEVMDLVVHDQNANGVYNIFEDRILVGAIDTLDNWAGTVMVFDFSWANGNAEYIPESGDQFHVSFNRPFWYTDTIQFVVNSYDSLDTDGLKETMKDILVVPNPYIATNMMETSVQNSYLNQRRELMFTNIPARCKIRIFTVSGVLVDEMEVNNDEDNGSAHWDMKTKENLEIAAGMYLYHVESLETGNVKMGKFAVLK